MRWRGIALVLLISGGAAAQARPPHEVPLPVHSSGPPEVSLSDEMLTPVPPAARSIATWQEAMALMRARSADLRIAYDEIKRAEGLVRAALGATLPTILGLGSYTRQFITATTVEIVGGTPKVPIYGSFTLPEPNVYNGSIQATQNIINVEAWHAVGTAQVQTEANRLAYDDLKRTVALNAATAIVGVATAERVAELNRAGLRQSIERYGIAYRKRSIGGGNILDVVRARRDVEVARAALLTGDEALLEAREALGLALGFGGQIGVAPTVGIEDVEKSCTVIPSLDDRGDLAAQRRRVEVARRNVTDVYEQFLPTLSAIGLLGYTNAYEGTPEPPSSFSIEGLLTVPIWDGGTRYGLLRQMNALRDEAEQTLEAMRRQAAVQVDQAQRGVTLAQHERDVSAKSRGLAAETDQLVRLAFETGSGTSLDLIIAATDLRDADINLALQEFGLVHARIEAVLTKAKCPW